ncbi:MAG: hydroxymethylbilane synthase, partial [Ilumatobacteraceae bacterium]
GGAIVMAAAALAILEMTDRIAEVLDPDEFVPAPGQGCVAIECRAGDEKTALLLAGIDHAATRHAVEAERAFLAELGTGCSLPVGAHAVGDRLVGFLADPSVGRFERRTVTLPAGAASIGVAAGLARKLDELVREPG